MMRLNIRWKMMLWNTAAFAVVLLGFGMVVYVLLRQTHYEHVDAKLRAELAKLQSSSRPGATPEDRVRTWVITASKQDDIRAVAFPVDGGTIVAHEQWEAYSPLLRNVAARSEPQFDTLHIPGFGHARRLIVRQSLDDETYDFLLLANLHHVDEEMRDVVEAIVITVPVTLLLAAALAYVLAWKSLAPVEQLRKRTDEITAEHLDRRLPIINPTDELGLLADTINAMIGRLENSFREVRRFTGDASHELRTPLAIIRSEAEIGIDEAQSCEAAQERFSSILEECTRLTWMTDQLLVLCREDAGVARNVSEPVDLAKMLREVIDAVQPLATARDITIESNLAGSAVVTGDGARLRQVFYNLLDNAFKFTPIGGTVAMGLERQRDGFVVEVRDTGRGISDEHLLRIFDRFYRVEKASDHAAGVGLGLSIVQSIVAAHGGRVDVQSRVGHGSTFQVVLPAMNDD